MGREEKKILNPVLQNAKTHSAFALLFAAGLSFFSYSATAANGCHENVKTAQQAVAQMRVNADKAADDQVNGDIPPSTTMMTCFNQAASMSGTQAGAVFSGDFKDIPGYKSIVNDSLKTLAGNFAGSVVDKLNISAVANVQNIAGNVFNCAVPSKYWGAINKAGVKLGLPAPTLDALISTNNSVECPAPAGAGDMYKQGFQSEATQQDCVAAKTATTAANLPPPTIQVYAALTPCQLMNQATPGSCP